MLVDLLGIIRLHPDVRRAFGAFSGQSATPAGRRWHGPDAADRSYMSACEVMPILVRGGDPERGELASIEQVRAKS